MRGKIVEKIVKDLDKIKLNDCNFQDPTILIGDNTPKFIDFIGFEFDVIVDSYLVNLVNYMKANKKRISS